MRTITRMHAWLDALPGAVVLALPRGGLPVADEIARALHAPLDIVLVRKIGLPRNESQDLVELVLGEISSALAKGEGVKLSSFGSFGVRQKGRRIGRNPKTGEEVPITPRRVLVFRPSNIMKDRINQGLAKRKAAE